MAWVGKRNWIWSVDAPTDLKEFIGRAVKVKDDENNNQERVIEIAEILGSFAIQHPTKFQINTVLDGKPRSFLISMLDFYAQMNGEIVSQQEIDDFDSLQADVRKMKWKKRNGIISPNPLIPSRRR